MKNPEHNHPEKSNGIRYKALFDHMPIGVVVYEAVDGGRDFVIREFNRGAERIEKISASQAIGKSVLEVFPGVEKLGLLDVFRRVWKTGDTEYHPISLYRDQRIEGWRDNHVYKLLGDQIVAIYEDVTSQKQTEDDLRRARDNWRDIFESISDSVVILDREHNIEDANRATVRILGIPKEKILGRRCYDVFHCKDKCVALCPHEKLLASGRAETAEMEIEAFGGTFLVTVAPVLDEEGDIVRTIHIAKDITLQKKVQEQRDRQIVLVGAINTVLRESIVCKTDTEVALTCLAVAEGLTGSKFGFIAEANDSGLFDITGMTDRVWDIDGSTRQAEGVKMLRNVKFDGFMGQIIKEGRPVIVNNPASRPNGLELPTKHPPLESFMAIPLMTGKKTTGLIGLANREGGYHLDDQIAVEALSASLVEAIYNKRSEIQIKDNEQRFKLIARATNDAVWDWDLVSNRFWHNEAYESIFGYMAGEVDLSKKWWEQNIHPRDRHRVVEGMRKAVEGDGQSWSDEYRFRRKDGSYANILDRVLILRDDSGKPTRLLGSMMDVTTIKEHEAATDRLNRELRVKNKELEQVLHVASHDLRSPLVNIQGFGHELAESCKTLRNSLGADIPDGPAKAALCHDIPEALEFISAGVHKIDSLLSGLLRLSRIGRAALEVGPLDMNALLKQAMAGMEYQIKASGVSLNVEHLETCVGDAQQINQVFSNLLDNAIKYLDESRPGVIRIWSRIEEDASVYCVEDNGVGIEPTYLESIFEIFHKLDRKKDKGEGLGLTIVRRIVDRHNGSIWVESEAGRGSRFFISLPRGSQ